MGIGTVRRDRAGDNQVGIPTKIGKCGDGVLGSGSTEIGGKGVGIGLDAIEAGAIDEHALERVLLSSNGQLRCFPAKGSVRGSDKDFSPIGAKVRAAFPGSEDFANGSGAIARLHPALELGAISDKLGEKAPIIENYIGRG